MTDACGTSHVTLPTEDSFSPHLTNCVHQHPRPIRKVLQIPQLTKQQPMYNHIKCLREIQKHQHRYLFIFHIRSNVLRDL
jgi:hypothetical protein